jgi:hypothetical protein
MPRIRKERAGSDSFGNHWPKDGSVVEVEPEQVGPLLAIVDGGFSEVTPTGEEPEDDGEPEFSEVDPEAPDSEPGSKAPAKKTTARKTATRKPVEE